MRAVHRQNPVQRRDVTFATAFTQFEGSLNNYDEVSCTEVQVIMSFVCGNIYN